MRKIIAGALVLLTYLFITCRPIPKSSRAYYGYEMPEEEYIELRSKIESQPSPYEADSLWQIYDQINDSIRIAMPDTIEFEIFLSLLNKDEVGIDVFVPKNTEFFEKIGYAVMNIKAICRHNDICVSLHTPMGT